MTDLIEKAEKEGRDLNAEEKSQYEQMDKDQSDYKARADRLHNASNLKNELGELNGKSVRSNPSESVKNKFATDDYKNGFDAYARRGNNGINSDIYNALQVGTNSEGGFIVPEEFETMLIAKLQDINAFRPLVNTIRTASDRNIPVESSIPTATWTAEEAAYTESDPVFARVTLSAYKLGVITKVSEELLQDSFSMFNHTLQMHLLKHSALRKSLQSSMAMVLVSLLVFWVELQRMLTLLVQRLSHQMS